jgi:predicted adenylyl cyclase CyaB
LKEALTAALGIKVVVSKKRRIYFVENVKFHFDTIDSLGTFVEVEAIDTEGNLGIEKLKEQCSYWAGVLGISTDDYLATSYSDMLLTK